MGVNSQRTLGTTPRQPTPAALPERSFTAAPGPAPPGRAAAAEALGHDFGRISVHRAAPIQRMGNGKDDEKKEPGLVARFMGGLRSLVQPVPYTGPQRTRADIGSYPSSRPVNTDESHHVVESGMFAGPQSTQESQEALAQGLERHGVSTSGGISGISSPNPFQYLALRLGFRTQASDQIAQHTLDAVRDGGHVTHHPHSQGVAQNYVGQETALRTLTGEHAPSFRGEAERTAPARDDRLDVLLDAPGASDFVHARGIQREQESLGREYARTMVGHHSDTIATGTSRNTHPEIPSTMVHRTAEVEHTMPDMEDLIPHDERPRFRTTQITDLVPFMTSSRTPAPNRTIHEVPGENRGIAHEHPYVAAYSNADAEATLRAFQARGRSDRDRDK